MPVFNPLVFRSLISTSLLLLPTVALAGGGANAPASPQPQPVQQTTKVWTNDDLAALGPRFESTSRPAQVPASRPAVAAAQKVSAAPLPAEQDPRWYAQELGPLEDELAAVSAQEEQLRDFRETGSTAGTGLNIAAPCVGLTTDNLIATLAARRREIEQQIDALADTARENGLPPGILVEGRGRVSLETPPTPQPQRADLLSQYQSLSDELAEIQETVSAMQVTADAARMTLLQPEARWGGNMTTNFLQGAYNRQSELHSQLSEIEDEARTSGIGTEALR